jgi:TonB family protein
MHVRRFAWAPIFAWCLVWTSPVFAQVGDVTAPKLVEDPGVSYPKQALDARYYESVEVVLVLEIDATGRVTNARVETPRGQGFDDAALSAASALRFEPARRAGVETASRIRFRYLFVPPPASLAGQVVVGASGRALARARVTLTDASGARRDLSVGTDGRFSVDEVTRGQARVSVEVEGFVAQAVDVLLVPGARSDLEFRLEPSIVESPAEESEVVDVTVQGERPPPAVSSYTRAEVRQIPGAFGDPFRAIETLPGVTPLASGLPYFYVRGSPPGNVGYFLDGVRVPYLYHIGFGPSVVAPGLVERVDLYPGGYPASLGRFAGGIVSAEATAPRSDLHGEGNLRLFDVGGLVEGGFADGRGTALVGGRYSYTATLLSLLAPEITLDYRDYQARLSYDLTPDDRVSVFSFGSYDLLALEKNGIENILFGTEFYRADTRYEHFFDSGTLTAGVTLGYDRTNASFMAGERRNVVDRSIGARLGVKARLGRRALLRAGADGMLDFYSVEEPRYSDPDSPETQNFDEQFPDRTDLATGLHGDLVLELAKGVEVTPGVRFDLYRSSSSSGTDSEPSSALGVDPRISARFDVTDRFRIVHAYGLAHQPPSFAVPVPGLTPSLDDGLQRSLQTSAGVEFDLDDTTSATGSLFYNAFFNMTDAIGSSREGGPPDFDERSDGYSIGLELHLERKLTERVGGFLTYTLSRSVRRVGDEEFAASSDRTHVVNGALAFDLGRAWRSGARVVFYTGAPREESSERNPPFFRLDLRLEKRWSFGNSRFLSFVAEVMNASFSKETFGTDEVGPIVLPSIGLEAGF